MLNESVDIHVTTADSDKDLVSLFNLNIHSLLSKLVHAFRFSQKEDVHLLLFGVAIDKVTKCSIDVVILVGNVDCLISFQELQLVQKIGNLGLGVLKLELSFTKLEFKIFVQFKEFTVLVLKLLDSHKWILHFSLQLFNFLLFLFKLVLQLPFPHLSIAKLSL